MATTFKSKYFLRDVLHTASVREGNMKTGTGRQLHRSIRCQEHGLQVRGEECAPATLSAARPGPALAGAQEDGGGAL